MWTFELLVRPGYTLFVIFKDNESLGSLQFPNESADIKLWQKVIENLNQPPE